MQLPTFAETTTRCPMRTAKPPASALPLIPASTGGIARLACARLRDARIDLAPILSAAGLAIELGRIGLVYYVMASLERLVDALRIGERDCTINNEGVRLRSSLERGFAMGSRTLFGFAAKSEDAQRPSRRAGIFVDDKRACTIAARRRRARLDGRRVVPIADIGIATR